MIEILIRPKPIKAPVNQNQMKLSFAQQIQPLKTWTTT